MMIVFKYDTNLALTIEDDLFGKLQEYIDENSNMMDDAFDMLAIILDQEPKVVIGETEEGDYILFEEDKRVLN